MHLRSPRSRGAIAAVIALGLAGCGGSSHTTASGSAGSGGNTATSAAPNDEGSKSANTIFSDAKAATAAASPVRISGKGRSDSETFQLNLVSSTSAGGGSITVNGATLQLVCRPPNVYLKGDAESLKEVTGSSAAGQLAGGRWLRGSTSGQLSSLKTLCSINSLLASFSPEGTLVKGSTTSFEGHDVVDLHDTGKGGDLYLSATGKPVILAISKSGSEGGTITFMDYGSAKLPAAPSSSIDLDQLAGGGSGGSGFGSGGSSGGSGFDSGGSSGGSGGSSLGSGGSSSGGSSLGS